jgi:tRNA dimethylallyltransferase
MTSPGSAPVIAIAGPTATGKTALGVAVAKALGGQVVSADSRLVYQELAIGTAKPTLAERDGVPHHLIDIIPPTETYSAACYREEARAVLDTLRRDGIPVIVVGGTGFYLRSLLEDITLPEVPPDPEFRSRMKQLAAEHGPGTLHQRLKALDPERAAALYPQDTFRIIRALEIIEHLGAPVPPSQITPHYPTLCVGLTCQNRELHRQRIRDRNRAMMADGWLYEVQTLLAKYGPDVPALQIAHGYPEWIRHLQGELGYEEALTKIETIVSKYSKRQMTWFRANAAMQWFFVDHVPSTHYVHDVLSKYSSWVESSTIP